MENPYASPGAAVSGAQRRLEWWNRGISVLIFLVCVVQFLFFGWVGFVYLQLMVRPEATFHTDAEGVLSVVGTAIATTSLLCAGILLLLRMRWAPYAFVPGLLFSLSEFREGFTLAHATGFAVLAACAAYALLLARRGSLR